jgi:hypothetical protein
MSPQLAPPPPLLSSSSCSCSLVVGPLEKIILLVWTKQALRRHLLSPPWQHGWLGGGYSCVYSSCHPLLYGGPSSRAGPGRAGPCCLRALRVAPRSAAGAPKGGGISRHILGSRDLSKLPPAATPRQDEPALRRPAFPVRPSNQQSAGAAQAPCCGSASHPRAGWMAALVGPCSPPVCCCAVCSRARKSFFANRPRTQSARFPRSRSINWTHRLAMEGAGRRPRLSSGERERRVECGAHRSGRKARAISLMPEASLLRRHVPHCSQEPRHAPT